MAIAYDTSTSNYFGTGATSHTLSHTCTGSNLVLVVFTRTYDGDDITGVTYNGAAMTEVGTAQGFTSGADKHRAWIKVTPSTGANNIVVSLSTSRRCEIYAASFTGARQSSQPDASSSTNGSSTSATNSVTTIADNSWVVCGTESNGASGLSGGTNNTQVQYITDRGAIGYGGPKTPAGSFTQATAISGTGQWTFKQVSLSPVETYGITQSADLEAGSNNYFSAADSVSLSITGNLTIEAWVNLESAGEKFIVCKQSSGSNRSYNFVVKSTGYLEAVINQAADGSDQSISTASTTNLDSNLGTWYHVAMVYTASTGVIQLFVNGAEESYSTQTTNATSINDSSSQLELGTVQSGAAGYYDGKMSLVRIWNTTRTGTQLTDNKCLTLGVTTNLKAEYTLNNTLVDSSGNGNTLTNNNSTVFVSSVPSVCSPASGPANLKSYNGNVTANIKSMNGNLIANVKSFDGNA